MDNWFDELDAEPGGPEPDPDAPPEWAAALKTRDRYEQFESLVRHWFRDRGMAVVISDGMLRAKSESNSLWQCGLGVVLQMCAEAEPDAWPAVVGGHFDALYAAHVKHQDIKTSIGGWEQIRPLLVARLWEPSSVNDTRDSMLWREDLPGLMTTLALNLHDHVRSITREEAAAWGKSEDMLFETAIDNVEAMTPVDVSPVDAADPEGMHSIFAESVFVAARALRFERFTKLHGTYGTLVSLPVRHAILAVPLNDRATIIQRLGGLIPLTREVEAQGPGSVSARVFWWRDGVWREITYTVNEDRIEVSPPQELVDLIEEE